MITTQESGSTHEPSKEKSLKAGNLAWANSKIDTHRKGHPYTGAPTYEKGVVLSDLFIPSKFAGASLADLTVDDLLEILETTSTDGIRLSFAGKSNAQRLARAVRPRVNSVISKYGVGTLEERSVHRVIEGDNLQAMSTLYRERGQVDLIIADPPYNTGKDFRYNDKWDQDPNDPGIGDFVSEDDGAKHTKWMKFMWPRLQMMKWMLKPGGVLAICIDHRELFHLGQMLDELFHPNNRLAIINWEKSYATKNDNTHVSTATEYVLVYARDIDRAKTGLLNRTVAMDAKYRNPDNDPDGGWKSTDSTAASGDIKAQYGIQSPFTGKIYYPGGRYWGTSKANMKMWLEQWGTSYVEQDIGDGLEHVTPKGTRTKVKALVISGSKFENEQPISGQKVLAAAKKKAEKILARGQWPKLYWGLSGLSGPQTKTRMSEVKKGQVPMTFWASDDFSSPEILGSTSWEHEESGHSQSGVNELSAVVGKGHAFETVKPLKLISKIIQLWCPSDGLVLDPFAGSGTTGHAVLDLNENAEANRRFILIEQGRPENGDSYARTLLADRLHRVITGKWKSGKHMPIHAGFTFISLGKKVDAEVLLQMERDEMVDTVISSHFDSSKKRGDQLMRLESTKPPFRYLVGRNADNEGFFLIWDGPGENTDFTEEVYEACAAEARAAGLKASPYNVYARLYIYQTDGVRFLQIPDRILADFGLDIKSEPFSNTDEE